MAKITDDIDTFVDDIASGRADVPLNVEDDTEDGEESS